MQMYDYNGSGKKALKNIIFCWYLESHWWKEQEPRYGAGSGSVITDPLIQIRVKTTDLEHRCKPNRANNPLWNTALISLP